MPQLFAIVPVPEHASPPADAIVVGSLDDVMSYIPQSLSRQEAEQIRDAVGQALDYARQVQQQETSVKELITQFTDKCLTPVANRVDAFEKQHAISAKRAEAERKRRDRQRVADYLDTLPDLDDPEPLLPAKGDNGELTIHHKPDPVEHGYEPDDAGGVPMSYGNVPMSYIRGKDDLDPEPPLNRKQVPQPVSISLNEE
jgi:hypothetical protein